MPPKPATDGKQLEEEAEILLSLVSKLVPILAIFLFLSGWAFLDYYYRFFGMNLKSLDIGLYDTLLTGFTLLFPVGDISLSHWPLYGAVLMWLVYSSLILVSLTLGRSRATNAGVLARTGFVLLLVALVLSAYFIARYAGENRARLDKGADSSLPSIVFKLKEESGCGQSGPAPLGCHGKLLLLRNGIYFLDGVAPIPNQPISNLQILIYRAEDLREVRITEHN